MNRLSLLLWISFMINAANAEDKIECHLAEIEGRGAGMHVMVRIKNIGESSIFIPVDRLLKKGGRIPNIFRISPKDGSLVRYVGGTVVRTGVAARMGILLVVGEEIEMEGDLQNSYDVQSGVVYSVRVETYVLGPEFPKVNDRINIKSNDIDVRVINK